MSTEIPFLSLALDQDDVTYSYGPDSSLRADVEPGETVEFVLDDSVIYPGTTRRCWVHVPHGYTPDQDAAVMVFNDGWWYLDPQGDVRAGIVLDNLVHRKDMPMTIGVFVDPGVLVGAEQPKNRNVEYDAFDDRYADFLLTDVLPRVSARYSVTQDPAMRGICGGSSGGNAAFTASWKRPESFSRVIGFLSSFAQMPGGNPYPALIATQETKPIRIFLQAAHRDEGWNQPEMNWLAENLRVAASLAEAGYDFRLVLGDGGHSPNHGGVLLPDALRWLWRS